MSNNDIFKYILGLKEEQYYYSVEIPSEENETMKGICVMKCIKINCHNIEHYAKGLFDILADNMTKIIAIKNSREENFIFWYKILKKRLLDGTCSIVAFLFSEQIVGYFQYSTQNEVLMIEEIEIAQPFRVRYNILGMIIRMLPEIATPGITYVEAYTNINNNLANPLLTKVGFEIVGMNRNGTSYLYRANLAALEKRFRIKN